MKKSAAAVLEITILDTASPDIDALVERMVRAVARDDVAETKRIVRSFDALGIDILAVEFEAGREGPYFDGFICDWASHCRSWESLAYLLRAGMARDDPNAEEVFGAMSHGIDQASAKGEVREKWIQTMERVIAPKTLRQAHWLLNHPMLWDLGPVARSRWIKVAMGFIALCEKAEISKMIEPAMGTQASTAEMRQRRSRRL